MRTLLFMFFISILGSSYGQGHSQKYVSKKIKGEWTRHQTKSCKINNNDSTTTSILRATKVVLKKDKISFFDNDTLIQQYNYSISRNIGPGSITYYIVFDKYKFRVRAEKRTLIFSTCDASCKYEGEIIVNYNK